MAALEAADRQEGELAQAKSVRLREKIAALREQMAAFKALEPVVHAADRAGCFREASGSTVFLDDSESVLACARMESAKHGRG